MEQNTTTGISSDTLNALRRLVENELDRAESLWNKSGMDVVLFAELARADSVPSQIPGHPLLDDGEPKVDNFIAFVVDIRNSSEHLVCHTSQKRASVSGIQRVFYETSALLPAIAEVIKMEEGNVTEYVGDGLLGLFLATDDRDQVCRASRRAALYSIIDVRNIVNDALYKRYNLAPLDIGIGLAYSEAMITIVGHPAYRMPKAIGTCIYRASKLSKSNNRIHVDDKLEAIWPTSKNGKIQFKPNDHFKFPAFEMGRAL